MHLSFSFCLQPVGEPTVSISEPIHESFFLFFTWQTLCNCILCFFEGIGVLGMCQPGQELEGSACVHYFGVFLNHILLCCCYILSVYCC